MKSFILTLIIWTICFIAIVAGSALTYHWYINRGPEITITFEDAEGLVPHQTPVVYHGVYVGWVHAIELDEKTKRAEILVRMTKQGGELIGAGSEFWVVRPEVSWGQISNLGAIATGDYVAVRPKKGKFQAVYTGLDIAPISHKLEEGLKLYFRAVDAGGINVESPILYRGLQIGEVGKIGIGIDKRRVLVTAYIYKEYTELVKRTSFFGNVSGFHASIHIFGASELGMDSMKTLMRGGIVMITPNMGATPAKAEDEYNMLTSEQMQAIEDN